MRSWFDLLLELGGVAREQVIREVEALPARVVPVEAALEVARDRGQAALAARTHPDRVQLDRGHAIVVHELPKLRQLLHQGRDDLLRRADIGERIGDDERLEASQRVEGDARDLAVVELLDVHAAHVGQGHCRRAKLGSVSDRKVNLVLGRDSAFESDPVCLRICIAMAMLSEIETLFFLKRRLEVGRLADQSRLAFFADPALEHGLDEDQLVPLDKIADLVLARAGPEHFGGRKVDVLQEWRAVEHPCDLHFAMLL